MTMRNVTILCEAANKGAAEALAATYPGGAGTFSVPLSTSPGVTDRLLATHWAGSGDVDSGMATAFEVSVSPMFQVAENDNTNFDAIIATRTPRLYRIIEGL